MKTKHKIESGVVVEPIEVEKKVVPEAPLVPVPMVPADPEPVPAEPVPESPPVIPGKDEGACEKTQSGQSILPENIVKPSWIV